MLIIKPARDAAARLEYAKACGVSYIDGAFAFFAADADVSTFAVRRVIGFCQFTFDQSSAIIHTFKSASGVEDDEAMQLLGRTVTSFIYRCGVPLARTGKSSKADERILKMLGFSFDDMGEYSLNVKRFYETPCSARLDIEKGENA